MELAVKDPLYRILPFHRLVQMLRTGKWYFAHPSEWDDPYEVRRLTGHSPYVFAQCWCRTAVSDAMWRIYSPDGLGVRIAVSQAKLAHQLEQSTAAGGFQYLIRKVQYVKQSKLTELEAGWSHTDSDKLSFRQASEHLFRKRLPFDHEAETRVVILDRRPQQSAAIKGRFIAIEPNPLIQSIFLDPRAPKEVTEALRHYLKESVLYPGTVAKSGLYHLNTRREGQ
jgi:hypothetical protein